MKKRILHIITSLNVGGAERALFTLLNNGLEERYENIVVSLIDLGHYGPLLVAQGVSVHVFSINKNLSAIQALIRIGAFSKSVAPHIIQGWMYHGNFVAFLISKFWVRSGILTWNVRITLESLQTWPLITRFLVYVQRLLSASPHLIIYNSDRSKRQHIQYGFSRRNTCVIANGFDTEYWKPAQRYYSGFRSSLGLAPDSILIGFVGRNHEEKNIANFLQALSGVLNSNREIYAILIGRGVSAQSENLAFYAGRLPEEKVFFLGERIDISEIMPSFDLFCLPSKGEGFPNVIGEAMACAVPCIATDVGDVSMIVGDTGWVVPSNDSDSLRDAINDAVSLDRNRRFELGLKARARIESMFSIKSTVSKYISVYDNALLEK